MEYSELLEFIDRLDPPIMFGNTLGKVDDEFLQLHSDFIVNQVRTFQEAGDEWENLNIISMPCIKHIAALAGVEQIKDGRVKSKARNTDCIIEQRVRAVATPLVRQLFESTFVKQMEMSQTREEYGIERKKVCTCQGCQGDNCGNCDQCRLMRSFGGEI